LLVRGEGGEGGGGVLLSLGEEGFVGAGEGVPGLGAGKDGFFGVGVGGGGGVVVVVVAGVDGGWWWGWVGNWGRRKGSKLARKRWDWVGRYWTGDPDDEQVTEGKAGTLTLGGFGLACCLSFGLGRHVEQLVWAENGGVGF
jgi:hypothetical protein